MKGHYKRNNPHRLYRDKDNAKLAGVCAGIASYYGFNRTAVRLICILLLFPFPPLIIIAYIIMALVIPKQPDNLYESDEQEEFWRGVSNAPADVFGSLRYRFRDLDMRLQKIEAFVTSPAFEIDRELNRQPDPKSEG